LKRFFMRRPLSRVLLFSALLFAVGGLRAAVAQVPPSAEPGIVSRSLERQNRPPEKARPVIVLPEEKNRGAKGGTQKIFVLQSVRLDQSTVYRQKDIEALAAPYLGRKVSFADLTALAQRITRQYRQDGYIFSRAVLPPQKIRNGLVRFQAVEGRITNVTLEGDFEDKNGLIAALAGKMRTKAPANTKDIERYLLLINDLPGITARSFVRPAKTPGGGDLVIAVTEEKTEGSASFDDRGSRYIGPWRGELTGAFNNLFGLHDRTTLRADMATQTKELRFGEVTHEEEIGSEGLRLKARYAVTATEPGGALGPLGIDGESRLFDIEALYPLLRSRTRNISLLGGFDGNNTTTTLSGLQVAQDRLRTARAGARLDLADRFRGISQLTLTATHGFRGFGAAAAGTGRSRANAPADFTHWNGSLSRTQDLWWPQASLFLSAAGQYSKDPLLAAEEFTVGGADFGRAYDAGELAGDRGYAGAAELRYGGAADATWLRSYQLYGFIDYGRVFNLSPVVGEVKQDSLTSAGFGVRFSLARDISGYVELAKPLNKNVNAEGNDNPRLFFSLLKRF
jgi:hemolysin activation/secretion protein